ncbi:type III-B CRISPR module RAMP protein Cmr6 [Paenibacillus sonchi]|uniref:type III-B CRISPR module RAMP protein Cmr6 n=1 Tax=Paenibacillus sonchi TaxID=373687 RepID=UPI001E3F882D|nr:type III-B CRISPR module RAMP protein Cmr6 [Paenibacillus sonchi]MCE3199216.1 type III-B CRISPR module RAMP protein Cmr6 [Paenibacillus sonchi]
MNAYLAITKQEASNKGSKLYRVVNGDLQNTKGEFYRQLIKEYQADWKQSCIWYEQRYEQYSTKLHDTLGDSRCIEFEMASISPLLIGHGGVFALETSLMLHRIYGVSYIPGSAIKGVAANYCHCMLGAENPAFLSDGEYYEALFGSQDQAGYINYEDAWVTPATAGSALIDDVMTPHHQNYNSIQLQQTDQQKASAPRDDDDPVPLPFLAVNASFRFLLTCPSDRVEKEDARQWLNIAQEIVSHALQYEGIGGKTNAGYGRMLQADRRERNDG